MMGMHLKIADAQIRGDDVPDFMQIAGVRELPAYWEPFASPAFTLLAIVMLPTALAATLGLGVFKRRVKGAYFAILSQALAAALAILLVGQTSIGGSNGLNRFRTFFGFTLNDPGQPADAVLHRRRCAAPRRRRGPAAHAEPLRRAAGGRARRRGAGAFPGLRPGQHQGRRLYRRRAVREHRGGAVRPDRRVHRAVTGRHPPVDRVPDRCGDRRSHDAARTGTGRDRRGMGADAVLRTLSVGVDLRAGPAVHRRRRLLPRGPGRVERAVQTVARA